MWVAVCYIVQDAKLWQTRACGGGEHLNMKVTYMCLLKNKSRGHLVKILFKKRDYSVWVQKKKNGVFFYVDAQNIPSQNLQMLY